MADLGDQSQLLDGRGSLSQSKTNLRLIEEAEASGEVAACYEEYRSRFDRRDVPPILKCFATHPPLLRSMLEIARTILFADGALSRRHKEMIATFVSTLNHCPYCIDSHGFLLSEQGISTETVTALVNLDLKDAGLDDNEQILLAFAQKVNANSAIGTEDTCALREAGWKQEQIAEAVHIASLFACFNRVANAFGLESQHRLGPEGMTAGL